MPRGYLRVGPPATDRAGARLRQAIWFAYRPAAALNFASRPFCLAFMLAGWLPSQHLRYDLLDPRHRIPVYASPGEAAAVIPVSRSLLPHRA
jgi:hypothetical protein